MAVRAYTSRPEVLLSAIRNGIANGRVKGWKIDDDGDLTISTENFSSQAWMRPRILPDRVLFNIVGSDEMSNRVYAVYHASLVQMLLTYFDTKFKTVLATALPTPGDQIPD